MDCDLISESSFSWSFISSPQSSSASEQSDWETSSFYAYLYSDTDDYDDLSHCPCCYPRRRDSITADDHEARDEHLWQFEPYRDLRSVACGKSRHRTIRENKRSYNRSYRCRMGWQAEKRMTNKREKREKYRDAVTEAKAQRPCYTRGCRRARHDVVQWDVYLDKEFDEWVLSMEDDLERYTWFNSDAEVFESSKPYIEVGEDFVTWCQRRTMEMRCVKESRLRARGSTMVKQRVWKSSIHPRYRTRYEIYIGDNKTTTLPTNEYDALGHGLLRSMLVLERWWKKRARISNASLFRGPNRYGWFGEYEWEWYQNESGCWEIGLGGLLATDYPTPCDYCDRIDLNTGEECYCSGWGIMPAPEEMQRCSLVEWVGKEEREMMLNEGLALKMRSEAMWEDIVERRDAEICATAIEDIEERKKRSENHVEEWSSISAFWDVVSNANSETWSVVDDKPDTLTVCR
ncbi:hypothetical protein BDU57DRAFT_519433 [Ampelomyces quisqualis]|uniref:Uncharacterized protein n=1 Tax=Ampelomyces quisqualis TaxID=50730 RepID=A0A6A5QGC8_AMPQU|nr:hypothetical protein BDU57DRAFT_519433 [Ampelomyces quisqualis]